MMQKNSNRANSFLGLAAAIGLLICSGTVFAQRVSTTVPRATQSPLDVGVLEVRENVFMLVTPTGENVTLQVGREGNFIVDPGSEGSSAAILEAIGRISPARGIRYVVLTDGGLDRAGAAPALIASAGGLRAPVPSGGGIDLGTSLISHSNAVAHLEEGVTAGRYPPEGVPQSVFSGAKKSLYANGEGIQILALPRSHTDGNAAVYFRRSDVIVAGNAFLPETYPRVEIERGGSIQGTIDALNALLELTIPERNAQGGTLVIPGRGRLSNESDLAEYRDMVTIIRDRVQSMVDKGMSLEQIKAAHPTLDYDAVYGSNDDEWNTERFIEAVHAGVVGEQARAAAL